MEGLGAALAKVTRLQAPSVRLERGLKVAVQRWRGSGAWTWLKQQHVTQWFPRPILFPGHQAAHAHTYVFTAPPCCGARMQGLAGWELDVQWSLPGRDFPAKKWQRWCASAWCAHMHQPRGQLTGAFRHTRVQDLAQLVFYIALHTAWRLAVERPRCWPRTEGKVLAAIISWRLAMLRSLTLQAASTCAGAEVAM